MENKQKKINIYDIYYEAFILSNHLVTLALDKNWEQLLSQEIVYLCTIERLVALSEDRDDHNSFNDDIINLLHKIIENERIIKNVLQQYLEFLSTEINQLRINKIINNNYSH